MARRSSARVGSSISKRRWKWFVVIVVVLALLIADRQGWLLVEPHDDIALYDGRAALVERVIDGDTIDVVLPDPVNRTTATRVRLWGIDAPEIDHGTGSFGGPAEPWGEESKAFAANLVEGAVVTLRLEPHRTRDRYDRLLAHVEAPDGVNLSRELLVAGLARVYEGEQHRHLNWYGQGELIAKRKKAGIWSD